MKRIIIYLVVNVAAIYVLANFFFGNGGVAHLLREKIQITRLENQLGERQYSLLAEENELLSRASQKNLDEYLLKHGYKPENTVIFRFVSQPPIDVAPRETHLLTRLYMAFGVLVLLLFVGEICLYAIGKRSTAS